MKTCVLLVLLLCCLCRCDQQCAHNSNNRTEYTPTRDDPEQDGFSSLLSLTNSFRGAFFSITTSTYERLRNDIYKIYTRSVTFRDTSFIGTAIYYCSEAQYLAAFVLSVSIFFPVVLIILWYLWIICYNDDDDVNEDDELLNKHSSLLAQVITWSLSCAVITLLLLLLAFGIILIVANERVGVAVTMSANAVRETLPTISSLNEEFLTAINTTLITDYSNVNDSIYQNELSWKLSDKINSDMQYNELLLILQSTNSIIGNISTVYNAMNGLAVFHNNLESLRLSNLITSVNNNITSLMEFCNETEYEPCNNLSARYYPQLSTSLTAFLPNTTSLNILLQMITGLHNAVNTSTVDNRIDIYNDFIKEIEYNVSEAVRERSDMFLKPINQNISNTVDQLYDQLQHITYGLPDSQTIVEDALGKDYLSNWQEFRSISTIAFSLSFVVFTVGVVLAIVRGIINTMAIYLYGDDELDYIMGAHMAAMMLKSFVIWVSIVGMVSAFFFVFILCLASIVGRGCGIHGNYSEIIDDVIDNSSTWGGEYPLGAAYFNDSAHPLTLHSVIRSCSANRSAAEAIQLIQILDSNKLIPTLIQEREYIEDMKNIPSLMVSFKSYSVLGTSLLESLDQYRNIANTSYPWYQYGDLEEDIFDDAFVGIQPLSGLLTDMMTDYSFNDSLTTPQQTSLTNIIHDITTMLLVLTEEATLYQSQVQETRSNSTNIQLVLERVSNITPTIIKDSHGYRMNLINVVDTTAEMCTLTIATNITEKIKSIVMTSTQSLSCDVSLCLPVAILSSNFTHATCSQLLDGLDIYWISLLMIFIACLLTVVLLITLACHLADRDVYRRQHNPRIQQQYNQSEQILSQIITIVWFILGTGIDLWFLVAIAMDKRYAVSCNQGAGELSCCPICLWVVGSLFLLMSISCSISLRMYQYIVIRRITASRVGKVQQIQRYWLARLKAAVFYEGLALFFLMYIPFIAISGSYITTKTIPTPPSFASLIVSLVGIFSFLVSMVTERGQIIEHLNLLQQKITNLCEHNNTYNPPNTTNGDLTGNGGVARSDGIQLTAINPNRGRTTSESDHTYEYEDEENDGIMEGPIRDTPIHETTFIEEDVVPDPIIHGGMGIGLEPFNESDDDDDNIDEECDQLPITNEDQIPSILLDRVNNTVLHPQRNNDNSTTRNSIRLAHLSQHTDIDASTPRSSLYMSELDSNAGTDLPPYHFRSLSHVPGYTSTDDSSYRDDYDSYDSDQTNSYYPAHIDGKQVEV